MNTETFEVSGMHCDGCASRLAGVLEKEQGVETAEASFSGGSCAVTYDAATVSRERLVEVIEKAGFDIK